MKTSRLLILFISVIFGLSTIPGGVHCEMSGAKGRPAVYLCSLQLGTDSKDFCEFSTSIERITFLLNTFGNKYKVIRIRVENRSAKPIQLSSEEDSIDLITAEHETVSGLFKLQEQDALLWDSLDKEMRETLAYPQIIRPESYVGQETMYFFAFFPKDKISKLSIEFRYKIDSLPVPIKMALPQATAK